MEILKVIVIVIYELLPISEQKKESYAYELLPISEQKKESYVIFISIKHYEGNKQLVNFDDVLTFSNPVDPSKVTRVLAKLTHLDVSLCSIEQLNANGFSILKYMPRLLSLNLLGNRIRNIYANPFATNTPYLNSLTFEHNEIRCDVTIQWVKVKDRSYSKGISSVVLLFCCLLEQFCEV